MWSRGAGTEHLTKTTNSRVASFRSRADIEAIIWSVHGSNLHATCIQTADQGHSLPCPACDAALRIDWLCEPPIQSNVAQWAGNPSQHAAKTRQSNGDLQFQTSVRSKAYDIRLRHQRDRGTLKCGAPPGVPNMAP